MTAIPGGLPPPARTPLLFRRGARNLLMQGVYVAVTALVIFYVVQALGGRDYGFGFLNQPAAFDVGNQWLTNVDGTTNTRFTMYLVGIWATVRVVVVTILLSTVLGVAVGVARLSPNWLVAKLAMLFVEIFRNTPLFVQIVLWYAIVLFGLPRIESAINVGDSFFLSNRGIAVPWPEPDGGLYGGPEWMTAIWAGALAAAAAAALLVRRRRQERERETGQPHHPNRWAVRLFAGAALLSFLALGLPLTIDVPVLRGTDYMEGLTLRPEFTALTLGLTIYTASFIAEIVRASIQALPKGQTEAANAVGLSGYQRLTLVILPQALRQMIPSVTNQYLNAGKNSSLASGVSYFDLFFVANIIQNKIGHAVEVFLLIIVTYMLMSLAISTVMNVVNARLTLTRV